MPDPMSELDQFKEFVYNSYLDTHPVYKGEIASTLPGRYWVLKRFLGKTLPSDKGATILDYGCGDGRLLSVAQELGYTNLAGVDLSAALLAIAARRTLAKLHRGDGFDFLKSSADGAFDVIIAFDVFEHLTRPRLLATCREVVRTLKPGGRLLLCVPNGASPLYGGDFWGDITHERPYTKSSLGQVLLPLGFETVEAMEITPAPHGWKSTLRAVLWQIARAVTIFRLAIETGQLKGHVLTTNMFVTARKASHAPNSDGVGDGEHDTENP